MGHIAKCPIVVNIFPFVRLETNNYYKIQMIDLFNNGKGVIVTMHAVGNGEIEWQSEYNRSAKNTYKTYYYALNEAFDYLRLKITNGQVCHESILIPKWEGAVDQGNIRYKFAFDFGTTNTHIAVRNMDNGEFMDFAIGRSMVSTFNQNQARRNVYNQEEQKNFDFFEILQKQEFVPNEIANGAICKFPIRTVAMRNRNLEIDGTVPEALVHVNIPFIYGIEDYGTQENFLVPNLKWAREDAANKLSSAFIEELVVLARIFALEHDGNLAACSFVWTYPLSMVSGVVNRFNEKWQRYFGKYFLGKERAVPNNCVKKMSESIAPVFYYMDDGETLENMTLSIDIGGGTCDVVIKNGDKISFTSFQFAADVIFGAGKVGNNPMIKKHYHSGDLKGICEKKMPEEAYNSILADDSDSSEANSFLFGLESNPRLANEPLERKSYNAKLNGDNYRKVIFLYFYASIIYYLTKLLQDYRYPQPCTFMFSGTGSKILSIIGNNDNIRKYTTDLLNLFSEGEFKYTRNIDILIESEEPKQITAKGALHEVAADDKQDPATFFADPDNVERATIHYSLYYNEDKDGGPIPLNNKDLKNDDLLKNVCEKVKAFNEVFLNCINNLSFEDKYLCDKKGISKMSEILRAENDRLLDYMKTEIEKEDRVIIQTDPQSMFKGALFFYPIKQLIQRTIMPNFNEDLAEN